MDSKEADIFLYKDFFVSTACRIFFQQILEKGRIGLESYLQSTLLDKMLPKTEK